MPSNFSLNIADGPGNVQRGREMVQANRQTAFNESLNPLRKRAMELGISQQEQNLEAQGQQLDAGKRAEAAAEMQGYMQVATQGGKFDSQAFSNALMQGADRAMGAGDREKAANLSKFALDPEGSAQMFTQAIAQGISEGGIQAPKAATPRAPSLKEGVDAQGNPVFADVSSGVPIDVNTGQQVQGFRPAAKKPLVEVEAPSPGETEFEKGVGRAQAESYTGLQSQASEANNQIFQVAQLEELLDQGVPTGPMSSATVGIRALAKDFGIDVDAEGLAQQEAFRTVANQMALRLRNPESGLGLTGNTSERDLQFLRESVPGLMQTEAGNRKIIELYKRAQQRKIDTAKLAEEYVADNGAMTGFSSFLAEWAKNNPLVSDDERKEKAKETPEAQRSEADILSQYGL